MTAVLVTLLQLVVTAARLCGPGGARAVIAENLLLRQQLIVLRRPRQRAPNLTSTERVLCGLGAIFLGPGRIHKVAIGVRPSTLLAFHQALVRRKYRCLFVESASEEARPKRAERGAHPGHRRTSVAQSSIRMSAHCAHHRPDVRARHRQERRASRPGDTLPPSPNGSGPSWLSFIGHTTDSLWSMDLFRCESIVLQSYWILVVMDQFTRRLVGLGVQRGAVDGSSLCRMLNDAVRGQGAPRHLSTDHDPLFEEHRWHAHLRVLEIDAIKTVPDVPMSHPFVERLIGTMRREFLDDMLFWNVRDLERKLANFTTYYNGSRSHAALAGNTPLGIAAGQQPVPSAELDHVRWVSHCRGLVQLPVAA